MNLPCSSSLLKTMNDFANSMTSAERSTTWTVTMKVSTTNCVTEWSIEALRGLRRFESYFYEFPS